MFRKSNKNKDTKEYKITLYGESKIGRCYEPCHISDDLNVNVEDTEKEDKR